LVPEYFNISLLDSKTKSKNSRQPTDSKRPIGEGW